MELFDKKFVYLEWDDVLEGKNVFTADTLPELRRHVENNDSNFEITVSKNDGDYPFVTSCREVCYAFVYYDPLYECKLAWKQGKQIQIRHVPENEWVDLNEEPKWHSCYEYRVKPTSKMWTACIDDKGVISVMPASDWNKSRGRQLIEGTREKCENFAIKNYCNKCPHHAACVGHKCTVNLDMWYCQGFRELKPELQPTDKHVCGTCKYKDLPYSCAPCKECMEDDVDSGERSMWEPKELKVVHRMTNRELAKWLAQGNGECVCDDISMTCWRYIYSEADKPVRDGVQIRGWDEKEWHEPEIEEE